MNNDHNDDLAYSSNQVASIIAAKVAEERDRFRAPLTAFAADLRECVPILIGAGMADTAAEFAQCASELEALVGPNV